MSDLSIATEALFKKSFTDEVALKIPMTAMLMEHRRVTFKGGVSIDHAVVKTTAESQLQMYSGGNEGLDATSKSYLSKPSFGWKYGQVPIWYGCETELQNQIATSEVKRLELVTLMVTEAQQGMKLGLNSQFHAETAAGDSGTDFQGIPEACDHSRTYGGILSDTTFTSAGWWGGASLSDAFTDRDTAMALSPSNLRKCVSRIGRYVDLGSKVYGYLPEDLYTKLQGILHGSVFYELSNKDNSRIFKYGFDSFIAFGVEWVKDTWMTQNSQTDVMLLVNPETFELRLHPSRAFVCTPFVRQDQIAGGKDAMLGRVKIAGNLVCWQPNGNMWKSNVS